MTTFRLRARPPFQFVSVVRSHGWYQLAPNHWDEDAGVLRTVTRLDGGRVLPVALAGCRGGVQVSAAGRLGRREQTELADQIRWMFHLDADLSDFYALAEAEPRLAHVRREARGRFLRSPSLFEDVAKVLLTTNIQWAGTRRLAAALVRALGPQGQDGQRAFPAAEQIARRRESTLRGLGLGYRAPYLLALARGAASGRIDLESLRDPGRPTPELRRALLALPGIGPYAAATLLGLLGRYEHIGVDTEAVSAVSQAFFGGRRVGEREVNQAFERWGRFKSLAYWFWDWDGDAGPQAASG